MKNIKYIGFYKSLNSDSQRVNSSAAISKMNFVCSVLNDLGYSVEIISPSWLDTESSTSFEYGSTKSINENVKITYCSSWKTKSKVARNLKIVYSLIWIFFRLILFTRKNEPIIVYHVPWLSIPLRLSKKIRGFRIILEIEEIYSDLIVNNTCFPVWEKSLINAADSYILSTKSLENRISDKKSSIVLNGEYKFHEKISEKFNDGKIHLLYAGIIDFSKRGAFNAIEASKYLSESYVLHIMGFGEVENITKLIEEVNKTNKCKVIYEGLKSGEDFVSFSQSCHIGLSTQTSYGEYLLSSFPSKVLTYLSLGLNVVSSEIDVVKNSEVRELINFYKGDEPKEIAKSILSVKIENDFEQRVGLLLNQLNDNCKSDLNRIINNVQQNNV